jgi:hypothetical protein
MRRLLTTTALLAALSVPAMANVLLDPHLSGTGDNVIFDGLSGNIALGSLNGQHNNIVDFTNLGTSVFTGTWNMRRPQLASSGPIDSNPWPPRTTRRGVKPCG